MKAALYHRVSTADQHPDNQRAELHRAALARGYTVELVIEETGSGAKAHRPGLHQLMAAVQRREVDAVFISELSRLSRVSTCDLLSLVERIRGAGVRLICTSQPIDVGPRDGMVSAVSELVIAVIAAVSAIEREQISERTRVGLASAIARGSKPGRKRKRFNMEKLKQASVETSPEQLAKRWHCSVMTIRRRMREMGLAYYKHRNKKGGSWRPIGAVENAAAAAA